MRHVAHGLVFFVVFALNAIAGDVVVDGSFTSTQAAGPPLEVASTDMVVNLNADMVDGIEGTDLYTKAQVDAKVEPRMYYLRMGPVPPTQVLTACATGFHTANLFELSQLSNLRYASDQPDRYTGGADAGAGPPTGTSGWVRTGNGSLDVEIPGQGNCNLWSSTSVSDYGTVAKLPSDWANPAAGGWALVWGTPWAADAVNCGMSTHVWCLED